ncbi:MAG: hypothetical protein AAFW84_25220 [Cyanobacteria bacterium J06635_15]
MSEQIIYALQFSGQAVPHSIYSRQKPGSDYRREPVGASVNDATASTISGGISVPETSGEIVNVTGDSEPTASTGGYTTGFILVKQSGATD